MKKMYSLEDRYRLFLISVLMCTFGLIFVLSFKLINDKIPDNINITKNNIKAIELGIPATGEVATLKATTVNFTEPVYFKASDTGEYKLDVKLFGLIHCKTVTINVLDEQQVIPCGFQIGIYLKTKGILVVNTGNFIAQNGESISPCKDLIVTGDYIVNINGEDINSKTQLSNIINENGDKPMSVTIHRKDEEKIYEITPMLDSEGKYKIGLWIKDDSQGIGTLTFMDSEGKFGALGHGISDPDTGKIINIEKGILYKAKVLSIVKGKNNEPGEFVGSIDYNTNNQLGEITKNCECGIYGNISADIIEAYNLKPVSIGYYDEVHKGDAYIRLMMNNEIKDYAIEIVSIDNTNKSEEKNFTIKVVSEELLSMTGGVVQGMSGSPVIQDGKIIGAVTHVFVDNPAYGYCIYIEKMLEQ